MDRLLVSRANPGQNPMHKCSRYLTNCSVVHGIIVLQEVLHASGMILNSYGGGSSGCSHCRQRAARGGKPDDGTTYSLLAGQDHHDDDVESGMNRQETNNEI